METHIQLTCNTCDFNNMYQYPGYKAQYSCPVCNSEDVQTCFVEFVENEWVEIDAVKDREDIFYFFYQKLLMPSADNINTLPPLITLRQRCTSSEIRSFVVEASNSISLLIKSEIESLITQNHLLDILDHTVTLDNTFETNVREFLDAVISDVARNPSYHEYYYPMFGPDSTLFTLTDFVHKFFTQIPEEYASTPVLFAVETPIGNRIQDIEKRLIEMLYG